MSEPENRDYLHEELQRRVRNAEYKNIFMRKSFHRRFLWRRMIPRVASIVSIALVIYILVFRDQEFLQIPIIVSIAALFSAFALFYLQPSSNSRDDSESMFRFHYYVDQKISDALESLKTEQQQKLEFTEEDKVKVLANIQAKLESEALQGYVDGIKELMLSKVKEESLLDRFHISRHRLGREVQDLAKRGNLNLILGILTTLSGLGVLGYAVFNSPETRSAPELFAYFVPRISLVLLIEIFAYFFLRLYKQSLSEIKYFQNEITNIEAKQLAMQISLRSDDPVLRTMMVEELSKTERNFILTKGQTTIDLERSRVASDGKE